jgi:TatA/E family protein of Tat protein translocase
MIGFGSIGGGEVMLILVVALLLFGPRKIPEIGKTLGKTMAEFRKATRDFKLNLEREVDMEDLGKAGSELRKARDDMRNVARDAMNLSPVSSDPPEAGRDQGSDDGNDSKD